MVVDPEERWAVIAADPDRLAVMGEDRAAVMVVDRVACLEELPAAPADLQSPSAHP
jgi:hypothetical protein